MMKQVHSIKWRWWKWLHKMVPSERKPGLSRGIVLLRLGLPEGETAACHA